MFQTSYILFRTQACLYFVRKYVLILYPNHVFILNSAVYQKLMPMSDEMRQRLLALRQEWESWEESESFDRHDVLALDLHVVNVFGRGNLK